LFNITDGKNMRKHITNYGKKIYFDMIEHTILKENDKIRK